jgi:hypothetical protein
MGGQKNPIPTPREQPLDRPRTAGKIPAVGWPRWSADWFFDNSAEISFSFGRHAIVTGTGCELTFMSGNEI